MQQTSAALRLARTSAWQTADEGGGLVRATWLRAAFGLVGDGA
jgi:hypothetical protein